MMGEAYVTIALLRDVVGVVRWAGGAPEGLR